MTQYGAATDRHRAASPVPVWIGAYIRALTLIGALAFYIPLSAFAGDNPAAPAGGSHAYRLATGDRITVTVFGQPDLSGDILIDGAGYIVLPLIGPIEVKDMTALECQGLIHDRLADGILQQPSVTVRISEFRPLYVLGDVRVPGAYPFRYGSTVKSAVALAGGFGLSDQIQNVATSEYLLADERVRQLNSQRQLLLIRRARLQAQLNEMSTFSPPTQLGSIEGTDATGMIANENDVFNMEATLLQDQLELLNSQKPRLQNEIHALNVQIETTKKQLELVKQHAEQYSRLVKQGLGQSNVQLQFALAESSHESEFWRLTAQLSHLQMDSGELDLKIQDTKATFKRQISVELREVRDRLKEVDIALPAAREVRDVKLQYAGAFVGSDNTRSIGITRVRNGEAVVIEANETTPLEPGDIVDVKKVLRGNALHESATTAQHNL